MSGAEAARYLWAWLALLMLFAILPGLDIAVSRLFFDPISGGFPMAQSAGLETLRMALWNGAYAIAAVVLILGLHAGLRRDAGAIPGRFWGFAVTFIVTGPVLLVNEILKSHWGRARPASVEAFGGAAQFTPPWQIAGQCANNCSFVSGEAASIGAACIVIGLLCWHSVRPERRRALLWALVLLAMAAAAMRVMKGRHFLSDVLWSLLLMATLARGLMVLFGIDGIEKSLTLAALRADARALWRDMGGLWHRLWPRLAFLLPRGTPRRPPGKGARRAGQVALALMAGVVIVSLALPPRFNERIGDRVQIALPLAGLGCAVAGGQGVQYFGRFLLMTTLLHGSKRTLGEAPINQRPHGGDQGFPSGHTTASVFGAAGLMQTCLAGNPPAQGAALLAAGFVGKTRHDVGAHDWLQIAAGALLGWLTQVLALTAFDRGFRRGWRWCGRQLRALGHLATVAAANLARRLS